MNASTISNLQKSNDNPDALLTKRELAPRLRKTERTIDAWMARGLLPYVKLPGPRGAVLFRWSDVLQALEKYRIN